MQTEDLGDPTSGPPEGYEGHTSTGLNCLRCGVFLRGDRWRRIHDAWHESLDGH